MTPSTDATCVVVMYHYIRDVATTPFPALHALSLDDFDRQLDFLGAGRQLIGYDDFATGLDGAPVPREAALLTFDDGVRDHHALLPRLAARRLTGVFFVSGDTLGPRPRVLNVHKVHLLVAHLGAQGLFDRLMRTLPASCAPVASESAAPELYRYDGLAARTVKRMLNYTLPLDVATGVLADLFEEQFGSETAFATSFYLSASDIAAMSRAGMTFGFHTHAHPVLSRLSRGEQRRELAGGPELIRELTGQRDVPFCIPHGHQSSYDRDTVSLLSELGYSMAFTAVRAVAGFDPAQRLEVPRLDTKDLPPFADVAGLRAVTATT